MYTLLNREAEMSLFSDINGLNAKGIKNFNTGKEIQPKDEADFSEVDFCVNKEKTSLFEEEFNGQNKTENSIFDFE